MPIPLLPFDTTEKIILIAVKDLVERERHQSTPLAFPLVNEFLLSGSLVSRTWRSISQIALLRNGIVAPSGMEGFIHLLSDRGMAASARSVHVWSGRLPWPLPLGKIQSSSP